MMQSLEQALQLIYLLLPAAIANMAPVIVRKFRWLESISTPIDSGLTLRGKPLLGPHKTWRGLISGVVAAVLITGIQALMGPTQFDLVDYSRHWFVLGLLLGMGALIGDAFKSLLKRRVGVPSGSPWVPYDQIDFGVGAILFILPVVRLGWGPSAAAVALLAAGHIVIVRTGYLLRWRKERW